MFNMVSLKQICPRRCVCFPGYRGLKSLLISCEHKVDWILPWTSFLEDNQRTEEYEKIWCFYRGNDATFLYCSKSAWEKFRTLQVYDNKNAIRFWKLYIFLISIKIWNLEFAKRKDEFRKYFQDISKSANDFRK